MDSDKGKNNVARKDEEPAPPGTEIPLPLDQEPPTPISTPKTPKVISSAKGVENAKKRLRAFSIQKKTPITPILVPKSSGSGSTTVLIGKLSSVKVTPKVEDPEQKKLPKPPKPGTSRKSFQDSYTDLQKRTLAEIEDMKRKMELVELGIPLGLICPSSTSEKAMPTKAMPPIKSFLDPAKVDDLIREAKKAKLEGKEFKFDYHKLLPDYDNPFQRKRDEASSHDKDRKSDRRKGESDKDRRKSDKYDSRRHDYRKDDMKYKERDRDKQKDKSKSKEEKTEESRKIEKSTEKETDVNLNDYLVCDSWSLDNDDKNSSSSPKVQEKPSNFVASFTPSTDIKVTEPSEQLKLSISKNKEILRNITLDKPVNMPVKMEKLQPVIDSFKFEIDPNDDEILDIFDEDSGLEKYAQTKSKKQLLLYDPSDKNVDYGADISKDTSLDGLNDDTFLESVINEIKQEDMTEDGSQDKGLVEYEISPNREEESPRKTKAGSVTPEIIDKSRAQSQRSDFSEGYRSSDSFNTTDTNESGYKSMENYRLSIEKELDEALDSKMSKSTVDSLETWNFVLKICQPLLFRHDKKKCYKETRAAPKIWYTESPKGCACVKDRSAVYEELEMSKMNLVDRVYGCDQIADSPFSSARGWYPRHSLCPTESNVVPLANEWEAEDSLQAHRTEERRSATPLRNDELSLDREYQRFMEAVWPDAVDSKIETSRSTTPVRQESRKKKKEDLEKETDDKKSKKIKLSSEGWSQESDIDEEQDKSNKAKVEKEKPRPRKRKHSTSSMSSSLSDSDENSVKKRKLLKKKAMKKTKSKSAKRRRIGRKILKKLKQKQNTRKQNKSSEDEDSDRKKDKKIKKRKQEKLKKKAQKKKKVVQTSSSSSSSSSDSSSESDSASERRAKKAKKRNQERRKKVKKQRKPSSSDSTQSEDLFDVNILNNIKTERLTDDEKGQKLMEFSPRRQKPREIINVKELQNDFVENIHIKKEVEEDLCKEVRKEDTVKTQTDRFDVDNLEPITEISAIEEIELPEDPPVENTLPKPVLAPPTVVPEAPPPDESNMSQCSSQESVCSVKDVPSYEKDESHLRPSSQNSNYSFNDVISASQNVLYQKGIETVAECEDKYTESYETANYEMYEQLAMAYQSDVASQRTCSGAEGAEGAEGAGGSRRIETVVRARCGEIKCDWRPGGAPAPPPAPRPSRWGLKPGEVNIVLTGEGTHFPVEEAQPIYQIQSIANRTDSNTNTGYDEAYMDMYGASDRLQYGDCFAPDFDTNTVSANIAVTAIDNISLTTNVSVKANVETRTSSLDDRINKALRETVLGEVANEVESVDADKDVPEKGILITNISESRSSKRVSFADGYKPGQDSDVEEPPVKKRKKARRYGCAWPCPAAHADHVPLWDALPPPPPPPGSPPPPLHAAPPAHLLRAARRRAPLAAALPALPAGKFGERHVPTGDTACDRIL
nr:titin-like [Vanessa tameamea]